MATCPVIKAQNKKVLFIGNSYTGVNNLPQLIKVVALSVGDSLIYDAHTPGGFRLMDHSSDSLLISKIYANNWDHIVIQAQSQEPSWDSTKVANEVFPHAKILSDTARANDSCTKPIFYMTWGRENGDANNCNTWPWVCTYAGMDSILNKNYQHMAADNNGIVSPVGALWNYLRTTNPNIQLYAADGSHPSPSGSYAAALSFYSVIFKKDPSQISFDFNLPAAEAAIIRSAAKLVVYDSLLKWGVDTSTTKASFVYNQMPPRPTAIEVHFQNLSQNADWFEWDFGDGSPKSTVIHPNHFYTQNGTFKITLKARTCSIEDSLSMTVTIVSPYSSLLENQLKNKIKIYPIPSPGLINIDYSASFPIERIELVNGFGQLLRIYPQSDLDEPLNLKNLRSGQYFLIFYLKDGSIQYRSIQMID